MPAISACILEPLWDQFTALLPTRQVHHPWAATAGASLTASSSTSSSKSWCSAAATAASPIELAQPPRCGAAATSGSPGRG